MKLNYKKIGNSGAPILILHGLFGSLDNWISIARVLSEKNFTVYIIDQRNHGQSPHSEEFNYSLMAADIKEFINEYALQNAVIIGHSMGGKTAMYFACKFPELLEKLIIVDISPKKYPVHHQEIIDALFSLNLSKIKTRNEADEELSIKIKDFSVRQFLLKNLYRQTSETFAWRFNLPVLAKNIEIIGEALYSDAEFLKPTLFIGGSNSNYILSDDENLIFRHFPKAQISIVKDAGHWIHAEAPEVFVEICFKFLF